MEKTDKETIKDLERRIIAIEKFIEKEGLSKNGRLVHCDKCGNSWVTRSTKKMVSCSSCGQKTKVE
jgi:ribosomal protein S27E